MRSSMLKKFTLVILTLGACATTPAYHPQTAVDRNAYGVVSAAFSARLPGQPVQSYSNCVMQNASSAEVSRISGLGVGPDSSNLIASIISRPQTTQCIARIARAAPSQSARPTPPQPTYQVVVQQPTYQPPVMPAPIFFPAPQVAPITLPGSNTIRCTTVGINTICR